MRGSTLLWRLAQIPLGLLVAASVVFALMHVAPGGPVLALAGEMADAATQADIAARFGLDQPFVARWWAWLGALARGDLGTSWLQQRPVAQVIVERLPVTLALLLPAAVLSLVGGLVLGLVTAPPATAPHGPWPDAAMLVLHAVPVYVVAALLVAVFSLWLGWLPVQGFADARAPHPGVLDHARHLALPVLTLALHQASLTMLAFRAGLHAELHRPHIVTAFARGAGFGHVRRVHAAPAALLPLAALAGGRIGGALAGAVLVETVFALPGLGRLLVQSAANRDHPVVVGLALCGIVVVMLGTLLADLLCAWLDPRIRR